MTQTTTPNDPHETPDRFSHEERVRNRRKAALWLALVCALIGLGVWVFWDPVKNYSQELYQLVVDREVFRQTIESYGIWAPLVFVAFQVFQVVVSPIPGELVGTAGGYTFGWFPSLVYSTLGLTIGSWINFYLARVLGRSFVERMVSPAFLAKIGKLMERQGLITAFIFFTVPGFPKDYMCYVLGVTPMSWRVFLVISALGRIPGTLMLSIQGALVFHEQYWTFGLMAAISLIFILAVVLWRERIYQALAKLDQKAPPAAKGVVQSAVCQPNPGPKREREPSA